MTASPLIGTAISHYRILSRLGAGGMGEVYLAQDTKLDRQVAIKFLPAESAADERARRRLIGEARAAAKLDHPHICTIHEVGEEDGRCFIVMQYVEGETLAKLIERQPLELREALDIAVQMADALAEAHSRGIVHRDVKPQNVMINARGQVKVLDFGLAKIVHQKSLADSTAETESLLTEPGLIIGTVPYMSPEQVRGETLDARSDIFSFGAVVYEMVSGRRPFAAENAAATISTILTKEPQPLARYSKEVPSELERIVNKTLRKNREQRYQSAKDLLIDLKSLCEELTFEAKLGTSTPARSTGESETGTSNRDARVETVPRPAARSAEVGTTRTVSSKDYLIGEVRRHKVPFVAVAFVIVTLLSIGIYLLLGRGKAINSIAVLPFTNVGADPNTEYLSDGVTDSLIYSLSRLSNLKVKSHSSVFRYKGKEVEPQTPGRELGVQAVLTGRIVQRGEMLVINAELVEVGNNNVLWGQQYNRKLSEIQSVQDEISREISEKLRLKLTGEEQQRLTRHYTALPEAYQAYLRGQYYLNHTSEENEGKAIGSFNQAIGLDPNYAQAYAGLAAVYADISSVYLPPSEAMPKAKEAVLRALALDESLAEAHLSLAEIHWWADWDFAAAEREFKRAIELSPNEPTVHVSYGMFLSRMPGRFDEAIAAANRGLQLDSFSVTANIGAVNVFYNTRHYDQAIDQARKTLEIDRDLAVVRYFLGAAYLEKGQTEQAITELQKNRGRSVFLGLLGYTYAVAGRKAEALKALAELQAISGRRYVSPYEIARIYAGLGEKEQAFEWLEKAYQGRSDLLTRLQVDPTFDSLRSDPRFADLVRRIGLEKY